MSTEMPPAGRDPATAAKLQILATEHWSLLATRSLTYTESLGRVNMFLAILSGAVIALALVAQADRFGSTFITVAILMLSVVLFAGVATVARLMALNRYDDLPGALQTLGLDLAAGPRLGSVFHGLQTLPGMLSVIVSSVAGSIGALAALGFGMPSLAVLLLGAGAFVVAMVLLGNWGRRSVRRFSPSLDSRFPSPKP
jgi:hypothetical protein